MNYGDLLYRAHENKCNASNSEVRCYKTSFGPPQKLAKSKVSSDNIKKFLARKEEEEKKKLLEAQRKKNELLALRSQDKKAQKRVQVMLKRTKSANKSVMEDAIDNVNTADTINGPNQCDNDDYGYVSQEASAFYSKLMSKYENMPAEPSIFSKGKKEVKDLAAAKDRVKLALQKEAEEAELPHKRKKRSKKDSNNHDEIENDTNSEDERDKVESKEKCITNKNDKADTKIKKKRPPAPPPLNFNELLKIAKEKQHQPIMVDTSNKETDMPRLMTSKEKAEYLKEEERKRNRLIRERGGHVPSSSASVSSQSSNSSAEHKASEKESVNSTAKEAVRNTGIKRIPKLSDKEKDKPKEKLASIQKSDKTSIVKKPIMNNNNNNNTDIKSKQDISERLKKSSDVWQKPCNLPKKPDCSTNNLLKKSTISVVKNNSRNATISKTKINAEKLGDVDQYVPKPKNNVKKELSDIDREIQMLMKKKMDLAMKAQAEQIPAPKYIPTAIKPANKVPAAPKSSRENIAHTKPHLQKRPVKRRIESDSEYDSELDDFIDDGPEEGEDYSKAIKEIFGYDKSRYRDYDDDEECMESNYAQQMREEFVSTKIGIMEDLEDIRKEQEEKRMKAKKMKLKKS